MGIVQHLSHLLPFFLFAQHMPSYANERGCRSEDQDNTREHIKNTVPAAFTAQKHCSSVPADSTPRGSSDLQLLLCALQTPYSEVSDDLQLLGFEPGWGNTIARARDTMNLALNLLEAPDSVRLSTFLSRMPNMFNVVILSPHGFFGQKDVLGKPDTGGQVGVLLHAMPFVYVHCYWLLAMLLCCSSCKLAGCWLGMLLAGQGQLAGRLLAACWSSPSCNVIHVCGLPLIACCVDVLLVKQAGRLSFRQPVKDVTESSCNMFPHRRPLFLLHFLSASSQAVPCLHRPFFPTYCALL